MPKQQDAKLLDNFEVFANMFKITLGMVIFNRPYVYAQSGMFNSIVGEITCMLIIVYSYVSMVECLQALPENLRKPQSNLTYGKVVNYILD